MRIKLIHLIILSLISLSVVFVAISNADAARRKTKVKQYRTTSASGFTQNSITNQQRNRSPRNNGLFDCRAVFEIQRGSCLGHCKQVSRYIWKCGNKYDDCIDEALVDYRDCLRKKRTNFWFKW